MINRFYVQQCYNGYILHVDKIVQEIKTVERWEEVCYRKHILFADKPIFRRLYCLYQLSDGIGRLKTDRNPYHDVLQASSK